MKTFCINLDHRPERWEHVKAEAEKMLLDAERISAVYDKDKKGREGCRDSHLQVLRMGRVYGIFCVLEDDAEFLPGADFVLSEAIPQLPKDWDMLYLGASPKEPQERYSDNLFRLKNAHVTHGILWNARKLGALEYILEHQTDIKKIDDYFAKVIQPKFNVFVVDPICATQHPFPSDICQNSDVSTIVRNHKKYCK